MTEDSKKTAAILGHNYPDSEWYEYIYQNLNYENKKNLFSKSIDKFFN